MKTIFTIVLLFFWSSIGAQVRPEHSGMWYNPDQDGHGLILEVLDAERSVGFWYLYDASGNPFWLLLEGENNGNSMALNAYHFQGMLMHEWNPATNHRTDWGALVIDFHDCMNATVTVIEGAPIGYTWDPIPMERLTHVAGLDCVDAKRFETSLSWIAATPWTLMFKNTGHEFDEISVATDGTFEYGGGSLLCNYTAQLSVYAGDATVVYLTHLSSDNDEFCLNWQLARTLSGIFYKDYPLCRTQQTGDDVYCEVVDEAMVFPLCYVSEDLGCDRDNDQLILWR